MAARFSDSSDESGDESNSYLSDENEEEYDRFVGVQGYQYEPKRKQKTNPSGSENTPSEEARSPPQSSRVGNTEWFVIFHFK